MAAVHRLKRVLGKGWHAAAIIVLLVLLVTLNASVVMLRDRYSRRI